MHFKITGITKTALHRSAPYFDFVGDNVLYHSGSQQGSSSEHPAVDIML